MATTSTISPPAATEDEELQVVKKVHRRLVWFIVLLFIAAYLDRINVGFAALSMNKDLGLSATTFGLATSIFYAAYICAEIPSNMMMPRFGAKLWIPRIMVTWGLASAGTMFATGPYSLYFFRALTGLAEAGFMPGILLYMTYWFPAQHRARATAFFIMAQPITILFGSVLSGFLLQMDGFGGIQGWKWMFLIEGAPSIILGVAAYFYLDNSPSKARWLSDREKQVLNAAIARDDQRVMEATERVTTMRELISLPIMLLCLGYIGMVVSLVSNSTWVPQIVRALHPTGSFVSIGLIAAIPALCAILVMSQWAHHSDRTHERRWHVALPMAVAAAGWMTVAWVESPYLKMVGLVLVSVGSFSAQGIFWTLTSLFLSPKARPVGIAMVSMIGLLGTVLGPIIVGWLKDATGNFTAGLLFVATCIIVGALAVLLMPSRAKTFAEAPTDQLIET